MSEPGQPGDADSRGLIDQAARVFDAELHTKAYRATHSDANQLDWILSELCAGGPGSVLDLGTGNGYVAMAVAERYPGAYVTGLDIAAEAIAKNQTDAATLGLTNTAFGICDGVTLPFPAGHFDAVVSRYAFHHFPRPETTLAEINRVMRGGCRFVLADAVRDDGDGVDFINDFQRLKQDGHVEMLRSGDLIRRVLRSGFELRKRFWTNLSFERGSNSEYEKLIRITPATVLDSYALSRDFDVIKLSFPIFNAVFEKVKGSDTIF